MLKIEIRLQEILKENISIKAENANLDTKLNILQEALRQYDKRLEVQHHIFDYVIYTVAFLGFIIIVIGTFGINRYIKKLVDNNIDKAIDDKIKEKEQILSIEIENKLIELSSKIDSMDNSLRESIKNKLQSKLIEIEKVISNKKDEIDTYTEEINQEKKKALSILKDMEKYKKDIDKSESEWIEIAFKEYNKERYNIALKYFENAEKINPNNSETLYIIGYIMDNNLNINKDKAIEYYKKAIELGETSAFNSLAYIYTFNDNYKNYKTAEDIIKLGIENNKDMTLYYNYGHILALQHKNIDSVIDSLQKAIDIDSNIKEHIRNISAFDYIKDDERFKKLIE
jgi:tetratricopeptide (TPR) repeat protein